MSEPWVLIETSRRGGWVAFCRFPPPPGKLDPPTSNEQYLPVDQVLLDPDRRHNRDLAPAIQQLLLRAGVSPRQLHGVMISIGPGSYTGLRVGVMTAKTLAWATGCRLVAIPTFSMIAEQTPPLGECVDVIADALQGLIYRQRFQRQEGHWHPLEELRIEPAASWGERLIRDWQSGTSVCVSGPAVDLYNAVIPEAIPRVPPEQRLPKVEAMLAVGPRLTPLERAELLRLEPLYLRGSSAEEKAASLARRSAAD